MKEELIKVVITYGGHGSTDHNHKYSEADFEDFIDELDMEIKNQKSNHHDFKTEYEIVGNKEILIKEWEKKDGNWNSGYLWCYVLYVNDECYEMNYEISSNEYIKNKMI